MDIIEVFKYARENKISDVHLMEDENIYFRIFGEIIKDETFPKIKKSELEKIIQNRLNKDFTYIDEKNQRYRINSFFTQGKIALVARVINEKPEILKEKFINSLITDKILLLKDGLILVTGTTGSGKSTTLANIIEKFNEKKKYKILTLEDPIEYIFENKKSLIIQREIGSDVKFYEEALKSSLRQNPDIVVVGEIRDLESLEATLKLAETGHLVLTTLHTNSAVESINRIISMVPSEKKDFVRLQLSSVLRFILSQELLIDKDRKKITAIFEILNNTKAVANMIANNKINQIPSLIESGNENYMITKEKYLKNLERKI